MGVSLSDPAPSRLRGFYGLAGIGGDWGCAMPGLHGQAHMCLESADSAFKKIAEEGINGGYTMAEVIADAVASAIEAIPEGYVEHAGLAAKIRSERPLGATLKQIVRDVPADEG